MPFGGGGDPCVGMLGESKGRNRVNGFLSEGPFSRHLSTQTQSRQRTTQTQSRHRTTQTRSRHRTTRTLSRHQTAQTQLRHRTTQTQSRNRTIQTHTVKKKEDKFKHSAGNIPHAMVGRPCRSGQPNPHVPQRTRPPPYPDRRPKGQRHAWST